MKKLSIRLRLTLVMTGLLLLLCLALTLIAQHQVRVTLVQPVQGILVAHRDAASGAIGGLPADMEPSVSTEAAGGSSPSSDSPSSSEETNSAPRHSVPAVEAVLADGFSGFTGQLWIAMGSILLLGALLTYGVASLALRPVKRLVQAIDAVDETTLSCDLEDFQAGDEVNRLASAFGSLLGRLRAAFERERRFGAYAAHEMKTPLAVVKTALDVMDEEDYRDPQICRETFQTIGKQNQRMIALTGQLLLLSKTRQPRDIQEISVKPLVTEILSELEPLAKERQVSLSLEALSYETEALTVTANPTMLKHAISNVIENAIRYNRPGGSVTISLREQRLIISDTGVGIPAQDAEHIFEPFYRVDKSRSRSGGGSGLGLAITREILSQCSASISYEANEPAGSRFIIQFSFSK